jgi:hypothetical protein
VLTSVTEGVNIGRDRHDADDHKSRRPYVEANPENDSHEDLDEGPALPGELIERESRGEQLT